MICALMPPRRKMCAKLFIHVVVPAPDDPVTAMMGSWRTSEPALGPEHRALVNSGEVNGRSLPQACSAW